METRKKANRILSWMLISLISFGASSSCALADGIEGLSRTVQKEMASPDLLPGDEPKDPADVKAGVAYNAQPGITPMVTLPPGSTDADLQNEINSAASGDVISISGDISFAGAVTVPTGADITIRSDAAGPFTLTQSQANSRHFIVEGKLTLHNIILDGGNAGGGVDISNTTAGNLVMNSGSVIQNCFASGGGGVNLTAGTFTMNGGKIRDNRANSGGGVFVVSRGTFNMLDGEISGNTADYGGGVCAYYSTLTMSGGIIRDNDASFGGGVYMENDNTLTMSDGEISGNTATLGGGVYMTQTFNVSMTSTLMMNGGKIRDNEADYGGGVFLTKRFYNSASGIVTLSMNGGEISGNTAAYGGGAYLMSSTTLTMDNGKISGNTADSGGGVCLISDGTLSNDSTLVMAGGEMNGNTADSGGGIYTTSVTYANLTIGANIVFNGNTASCYYMDAVASSYPNIQFAGTSVATHPLNNYDISYTGSLAYYAVTYNANGGNGTAPAKSARAENELFPAAANTFTAPTGMQFREWNTQSDGLGIGYAPGAPITMPGQPLSLFAIWESACTLTVQAGTGGSVNTAVNGSYAAGSIITITATGNSGYRFSGWTSNNGGYFANASSSSTTFTMPSSHVILTASFTKKNGGGGGGGSTTCTVTYSANGGTGNDHRVTDISSGSKHTVLGAGDPPLNYDYDGYTFTGWSIKADGSGTNYTPGNIVVVTGSITLYAQWKEAQGPPKLEMENHISFLSGYPDGSVGADNAITRAEAAAIFYRLLVTRGTAANGRFSDVTGGEWYAQAVNYLAFTGVLSGYPDGTSRPDEPITRAEFATMAAQFDSPAVTEINAFNDVSNSHWAVRYINSACAKGWINGYTDGLFRPENGITRAEVVTIVNAMLNRKIDADALAEVANPYHDITGAHWAYAEIIEASRAHDYMRDGDGTEIWQMQ